MKVGSLFSGYGGLDLAVEAVLGATPAWHSEVDPHASKLLAAHWPGVPNLGDITAIDWSEVEPVDVICGGFPCQDISSAGRGAGIKEGTRSGLWYRYADAVRILRPGLVFVENVGALVVRGLDIVVGDLAAIGYDAEWACVRASDVGAPHRRERLFLLAWPAADADHVGRQHAGLRAGSRAVAGGGGLTPADAVDIGHQRPGGARGWWAGSADGSHVAADADCGRRLHGAGVSAGHNGPGLRGGAAEHCLLATRWGPYADAIHRWERILGRPAPAPTDERGRLAPAFPEWMMGLPEGWVTGHGLTRSAGLKAIGNGVCPQQGAAALAMLLERAGATA